MFRLVKFVRSMSQWVVSRADYPTCAVQSFKHHSQFLDNIDGLHDKNNSSKSIMTIANTLERSGLWLIKQSQRVYPRISIKMEPPEKDEHRLTYRVQLRKQIVIVAMDEAIDGQLTYEFFNQLNEQSVDAKQEEEENLLQLHISYVADHLGLKVLWFNLASALLYGNNYQAHFGSDQMLYHLRENLQPTQWCATKEMNIQYSITPKTLTNERILRHDLVIFNIPCEDADSALISRTSHT